MKKQPIKPTRYMFNILREVCNLIPQPMVSKIARASGAEDKAERASRVMAACDLRKTGRRAVFMVLPLNVTLF